MQLEDLRDKLNIWLQNASRITIVGIGNTLRRDDGVGIAVVDAMAGQASDKVQLIRAETVPESFVGKIAKADPSHVLLIDAGDFGGTPSEARLVDEHEIDGVAISTHSIPLKVMMGFLKRTTKARVALLAIQPRLVEFGEKMSPELMEATSQISQMLIGLLSEVK